MSDLIMMSITNHHSFWVSSPLFEGVLLQSYKIATASTNNEKIKKKLMKL
ncbi:hypothetical protein Hanom_Chr12g01128871 [Helianthus anomalus]